MRELSLKYNCASAMQDLATDTGNPRVPNLVKMLSNLRNKLLKEIPG